MQIGSLVNYTYIVNGREQLGQGIVADLEQSPLSNRLRVLIVDNVAEMADCDAGRWRDGDDVTPISWADHDGHDFRLVAD